MANTNKTLQLKRKTGLANVQAAKDALETAFASNSFAEGEPLIAITTGGEIVLGIKSSTSGSTFYNAASVDGFISALNNKIGDLASLDTDTKTSIVAAINSLKAENIAYDGTGKAIVSGTTNVDAAIAAIDTAIAGIQAGEAEYTIVSADTASLGANVKEAYKLQKTVGSTVETVGETIKIYKDSALLAAQLGHSGATWDAQAQEIIDGQGQDVLILVYEDKEGDATVVEIPLGDFLKESEFKDGLQVVGDEVSVKLDTTAGSDSAKFLYMKEISGENGAIALSGITEAISTAVSGAVETLDATVGSTTVDTGKHVAVQIVEVDGKLTGVTVTEDDIASAAALTGETAARKAVLGQNGDTYVANSSANYISGATSMNNADVLLDTQVKANADAIAALENAKVSVSASTATESAKYLTVTANADETVYTIQLSGIEAKITSDINAKVATLSASTVGESGKFIQSISESNGIITAVAGNLNAQSVSATAIDGDETHAAVAGTTVEAQINSISQTLKSQADGALTAVTAGNAAIEVGTKANNAQSVSLVVNNTGASADLLSVDSTNGLTISDKYDCGTWS